MRGAKSDDAGREGEVVPPPDVGLPKGVEGVHGPPPVARGHFVCSSGNVVDEMVKEYMESQDGESQDDGFTVT